MVGRQLRDRIDVRVDDTQSSRWPFSLCHGEEVAEATLGLLVPGVGVMLFGELPWELGEVDDLRARDGSRRAAVVVVAHRDERPGSLTEVLPQRDCGEREWDSSLACYQITSQSEHSRTPYRTAC